VLRAAALAAKLLPQRARQRLYRMGPVSEALRTVLTRSAWEGPVETEIAAGPLAGMQMQLDLRREKDLWLGTYEPALLNAIDGFAAPGLIAYDVGANIGYVSLALAIAVGKAGQVVAFEPLPENLDRLRANMALNSAGSRVQVVGSAVGARTAQEPFMRHASGGMGKLKTSKGRQTEYEGTLTVDVIALDDWIKDHQSGPPELIKIDVEGGEAAVLEGMSRTLEHDRPTLLIELHGPEATAEVQQILASTGYTLHAMEKGYLELGEITSWKSYAVALPTEEGTTSGGQGSGDG